MNVFFTNISFDGRLHIKIDPYTLVSSIFLSFQKTMTFNIKNTLLTGSMFFDAKEKDTVYNEIAIANMGESFGNTIFKEKIKIQRTILNSDSSFSGYIELWDKKIALHEIIHTFQYENSYYFNFGVKYLYINPSFGVNYLINNINGYNNNLFEKEADCFSNSN